MSKKFPDINLTIENVKDFHDHMLADYVKELDITYLVLSYGLINI